MDRRELIGFLAGVPMLAALADEVASASPSQKPAAAAAAK